MSPNDAGVAAFLPSATAPRPMRAADASVDVDGRLFEMLENPLDAVDGSGLDELEHVLGKGGKLLFYHGMSDPTFHGTDTIDYYERMAAANGGLDKVQSGAASSRSRACSIVAAATPRSTSSTCSPP